jgi:hypothetical protein
MGTTIMDSVFDVLAAKGQLREFTLLDFYEDTPRSPGLLIPFPGQPLEPDFH